MAMTRQPTVLHIITRLVAGGAARVVLDQSRLLHGVGWNVHLAAGPQTGSEGSFWPEAEAMAARGQIVLHPLPDMVRELSLVRDAIALIRTRALISRIAPTIVHAHTSKAGLIGTLAARRIGGPGVVLTPHGHIFNREAQIPGIPKDGIKRWVLEKMAALSSKAAHVVTCPNQSELDEGLRVGVWTASKARVVPNGIDTAKFVPRDRLSARQLLDLPIERKIIGVAARLTPEKGVDLAISALKHLPQQWLLTVVGDGPERENLARHAEAEGVADRVRWLGKVDDMAAVYPAFDMLMVPSRSEAHGLVAAEAMACGVPVVAARVGGLQSVVAEGTTGTFAAPEDPKSLAAAATWVANQSPESFAECRDWVESRWSHRAMLEAHVATYEELAGDTR